MADLRVIKVVWTGATGLPGVSVFHSADPDDPTGALGTWFTAIKAFFPSPMSWSIPSQGDTVDADTGTLTGGWSGGTAATVACTGAVNYAAGTGCFIRWSSSLIVGGRRLRARTFMAPMSSDQYFSDGTIANTTITTMNTATTTLASTNKLVAWHRPPVWGSPGGIASTITAGAVADQVTSLKSRRV